MGWMVRRTELDDEEFAGLTTLARGFGVGSFGWWAMDRLIVWRRRFLWSKYLISNLEGYVQVSIGSSRIVVGRRDRL